MKGAVALVTARAARALDEDLAPLAAAFGAAGAHAEILDWDDPAADWGRFDAALLRSAWDYAERLPEFLAWVERTAAVTRLFNPPAVVRWNADKHYLGELVGQGLPVVSTAYAEPGADASEVLQQFLAQHACLELVVKPAVGAGARDARRHARTAVDEIVAHMRPLLAAGRSVMLQPYLERVDTQGETAMMFIAGRFSHAIRKGPLLPRGARATAELFAREEISARSPAEDELATARGVLAALPFGELLYARVDCIRDAARVPRLLELEITEPSMYFAHAPGSAKRLADAVLGRVAART